MRRLWLLAILVAIVLVACGEILPFGVDSSNACSYVVKKHKAMTNSLSLDCRFGDNCVVKYLYFSALNFNQDDPVLKDPGYCHSTKEFEYVYEKDGKSQKVNSGTTVYPTIDPDDHIRFSLFDSANVEKVYDIDLSALIHSYTVKDDSVSIGLLDDMHVSIKCPYCTVRKYDDLCEGIFACNYYGSESQRIASVGVDSLWGKDFSYSYELRNQSSMYTDYFLIHGVINFR